ncbi:hypothetical protein KAW80_03245 [Candidatus Babeliales bacterium]|nr:hypothetical protein [Candidatus Babeliales bacterium]
MQSKIKSITLVVLFISSSFLKSAPIDSARSMISGTYSKVYLFDPYNPLFSEKYTNPIPIYLRKKSTEIERALIHFLLVQSSIRIDEVFEEGSLLHMTAWAGDFEMVKMLIKMGADPFQKVSIVPHYLSNFYSVLGPTGQINALDLAIYKYLILKTWDFQFPEWSVSPEEFGKIIIFLSEKTDSQNTRQTKNKIMYIKTLLIPKSPTLKTLKTLASSSLAVQRIDEKLKRVCSS